MIAYYCDKIKRMINRTCLFLLVTFSVFTLTAQANSLKKCWKQQVKPLKDRFFTAIIVEQEEYLAHSMNPWDKGKYAIEGRIWLNKNSFFKADTLTTKSGKNYYSKTMLTDDYLLFMDYGNKALSTVTPKTQYEKMIHTCRYSPVLILDYFYKKKIKESPQVDKTVVVYEAKMADYHLQLFIDKSTSEVTKIITLSDLESDDEYYGFGDVADVYIYENYAKFEGVWHPKSIQISKLNGQLKDSVQLSSPAIINKTIQLLEKPAAYKIQADKIVEPDITIEKYSDNIHFINLHHCGTRSLMVEFLDFVLVAESPLNSKNGALLLKEVKKIAPNKPIKYFTFGHFHPHYTGGIRPFIHQEASIICTRADQDYIEFIANSPHTINPDNLQLAPKKVKFEEVVQEKTITDGLFDMKIYHIGAQSNHTTDYLIYYFPSEKMIFQDDLVWLSKNTTKENISKTTKGFYEAVKALNLAVEEVVQNWSVFNKADRMIFKFETIEKIMEE